MLTLNLLLIALYKMHVTYGENEREVDKVDIWVRHGRDKKGETELEMEE